MRGLAIGFLGAFLMLWSISTIKQYQADHNDPPCNGIYQVNGYMPCESPWSKETGSTQYFYVEEPYDGVLICGLWTGSSRAIDAWESGRAWGTQEAAELALGKKFQPHSEAGSYMKEINRK